MTGAARCALTRAFSLHARHHFAQGGPPEEHGHLYRIECTVRASIDAHRPTVIDLALLDELLATEIARPLDGSDLNRTIPEFACGAQPPTCEGLAAWCWRTIASRLPPSVELERVRVAEDASLWADCTGIA